MWHGHGVYSWHEYMLVLNRMPHSKLLVDIFEYTVETYTPSIDRHDVYKAVDMWIDNNLSDSIAIDEYLDRVFDMGDGT